MELADAIEVVREFQAWRRGGDQPMPYPQTTGEAIDALCYHAERMEAELAVWKHDVKRLEAELEQERQDRKQADLDTIRALGERNEARAEIAVWKHEAKRLEAELETFDEKAIEWWCEYQDLKAKAVHGAAGQ